MIFEFGKWRSIYLNYKPVIKIGIILVSIIVFGSLLKGYIASSGTVFLFNLLGTLLAKSTVFFLNIFGLNVSSSGSFIQFQSFKYNIGLGYFSLYHATFIFCGILILNNSWEKKFVNVLWLALFLISFNLIRTIAVSISIEFYSLKYIRIIRELFQLVLNVFVLFLILHWFKYNFALKRALLSKFGISKHSLREFIKRLIITLIILFCLKYIINSALLPFGNYMAFSILWFSKGLLNALGYATEILYFRHIKGSLAGIKLADPCLGINLIIAYASFIAIVTGKWINKLWFITGGIVIIYFLNVLRMSLLYIYLAHHQGRYSSFLEIHDLYNYSIYILTFALWVIWVNKYSKE